MVRFDDLNTPYDISIEIVKGVGNHVLEFLDLCRATGVLFVQVDESSAWRRNHVADQQKHHFVVPVIVRLIVSVMV